MNGAMDEITLSELQAQVHNLVTRHRIRRRVDQFEDSRALSLLVGDHLRARCVQQGGRYQYVMDHFEVIVPDVDSDWTYLVNLHEIGHCVTQPAPAYRHKAPDDVLSDEINAWRYAVEHTLLPITEELTQSMLYCIGTYDQSYAKETEMRATPFVRELCDNWHKYQRARTFQPLGETG